MKRLVWIDVIVLASLYLVRVLIGGYAAAISISAWLLAFTLFVFVGLAVLKRYSELAGLAPGSSGGRAYRHDDAPVLLAFGSASSMVGVLVLAQYLNSDAVRALYAHEQVLWLACPVMVYWQARLWTLASRGLVRSDPLLFATSDPVSLACAAVMLALVVLAA